MVGLRFLEPFETAFAAGRLDPPLVKAYLDALLAVGERARFDDARTVSRTACSRSPRCKDTLARASAAVGDFTAAFQHHRKALSSSEPPLQWECHAAQTELLSGQPSEAAARLERALAREPGNGFLLAYLGVAWTLISDPRAETLLAEDLVITKDPGHPPKRRFSCVSCSFCVDGRRNMARQHPFEQTLRGGTQTQGNILRLRQPAVSALRVRLERAVETPWQRSEAGVIRRPTPPLRSPAPGAFPAPGPCA